MNPEPPSREHIEARITALLLNELPADEAALLRYTMASDPALQQLHDQIKATLPLVREVAKHPDSAPENAPLKLSADRRQQLLAQFKKPRTPAAPEPLFWLKRIRVPSLIPALVALAIVAVMASMLLPTLSSSKRKAQVAQALRGTSKLGGDLRNPPAEGKSFVAVLPHMAAIPAQELPKPSLSLTTNLMLGFEPTLAPPPLTLPGTQIVLPDTETGSSAGSASAVASSPLVSPIVSPAPGKGYAISGPIIAYGDAAKNGLGAGTQITLEPARGANAFTPPALTPAPVMPSQPPQQQWVVPSTVADSTVAATTASPSPVRDGRAANGLPASESYMRDRGLLDDGPGRHVPATSTTVPPGNMALAVNSPAYISGSAGAPLGQFPAGPETKDSPKAESAPAMPSGGLAYISRRPPAEDKNIGGFGGGSSSQKVSSHANRSTKAKRMAEGGSADSNSTVAFEFNGGNADQKVPIAGDVPVMGNLFQSPAAAPPPAPKANPPPTVAFDRLVATRAMTSGAEPADNFTTAAGVPKKVAPSSIPQPDSASFNYQIETAGSFSPKSGAVQLTDLAAADKSQTWHAAAKEADRPLPQPAPNAPIPQPEVLTQSNAFSTFSLNVSDVSFKFAQASLQNGKLPDASSIRSEEFINAFDYRDPEAAPGQAMAFAAERARYPFAHNRELLRFAVKTAAVGRPQGRALNLVLLLDNSGSMERADRVAIIREALRVLATQLQPQDTVSIVTFSRTARLWADGVRGDQAGATLDRVGGITPEGGTNLEEAMRLAYETAHRHYLANGLNRVVLLTDGAANLGNAEPRALTEKADAQRRQGIALDCFGIGWEDYNDNLLELLSSNGGGRYAFLNSPEDAAKGFAAKLAGALQIAAADVKVQVEFNPARVIAYRQIGYARHQLAKEQFRDNTVAAGEIAAQEAGNALYTIEANPRGEGPVATVHVRYRVPGTQEYREHNWDVPYDRVAPALDQSSPAMRLAATAAAFSEWLAASPYAQGVTPDELLKNLGGVPQVYGADDRPQQLETMIREAKSVEGK